MRKMTGRECRAIHRPGFGGFTPTLRPLIFSSDPQPQVSIPLVVLAVFRIFSSLEVSAASILILSYREVRGSGRDYLVALGHAVRNLNVVSGSDSKLTAF